MYVYYKIEVSNFWLTFPYFATSSFFIYIFLIWFNSFNFILNWFLKGRINTLRSRLIMRLILFSLWLHLHSLILPIQQISFFCFPCSPSTNANNLQLKPVSRVEQNLNPTVKIKESVAEASLLWKANSEPKVSIRICFQLKTYLPVIIFYILPSLSLSLSLSLYFNQFPSIFQFTPLSIFFIQAYAIFCKD